MTVKLLTTEEAAERLRTTPRHVRRLVFERRIAYARSAATSASTPTTWPSTWPPTGSRSPGRRARYRDPRVGSGPGASSASWTPSGGERTTATLRPSTRKDYQTLLKNQVLPTFGEMTLVAIDALLVREWVAELVAGGAVGQARP